MTKYLQIQRQQCQHFKFNLHLEARSYGVSRWVERRVFKGRGWGGSGSVGGKRDDRNIFISLPRPFSASFSGTPKINPITFFCPKYTCSSRFRALDCEHLRGVTLSIKGSEKEDRGVGNGFDSNAETLWRETIRNSEEPVVSRTWITFSTWIWHHCWQSLLQNYVENASNFSKLN